MTTKNMEARREAFEAWHNNAYGTQNKYNPIRSLDYDTFDVGLGYDDPVVSAQFFAFCGALDSICVELPAPCLAMRPDQVERAQKVLKQEVASHEQ